ncbi:glycosyl hydrolase family 28 protein [Prevotella sp. E9-3]|uniref:rhamnogalacturonidase n=1 Tax=Prevotella sp. E9-3 TaxID=2913621 RepID=UPI001EDA677F|nr:glycosyl hydrolase family 28 protein [Prevotella sp. E9-3]UKK49726.1 glycosyl hydrolase family 28 protein [Prevotella sp. E9-3]
MKQRLLFGIMLMMLCTMAMGKKKVTKQQELWPNGEPISEWFLDTAKVDINSLGKKYILTDYGVRQGTCEIQTKAIQAVIDRAAVDGGGVIVVPKGTFFSGSLFFKQGTHLYIEEGGVLKGSERVHDFEIRETRIEGQTCQYFTALINADGVDGFTISGKGTIDGNGTNYWEEFWIRRKWNPQCTNKDAQRPRLTYISNSKNVTIQDVRLINSPFWTNHIYRCDHVRYLDLYIYSSTVDIKGPSTDAIDIDVCHDVVVRGCYMNVNDDAVVLKGGKGTFADKAPENGPCYNILVENCHYGTVHGCMTLGSESIHDWNVIMRNCQADNTSNVLWLKMRPDTPQHYEYVQVENFTGHCRNFLLVRPWTQFYQKQEREDMPLSQCNNISFKNIKMDCGNFFAVEGSDKYVLKDFSFENIDCKDNAKKPAFKNNPIDGMKLKNVVINGEMKTEN